jgi:uncharacterized membrane protein
MVRFWIVAGANHFFNTPFYVSIMPPYLPWHLALVYISGIAELGLGALLLFQRWSVSAGWGLIALLIAVFLRIFTWLCILSFTPMRRP